MTSDNFEQVIEDVPFTIKAGDKGLELACCDCGLVHDIDIDIVGKYIKFTFKIDHRATKERRRKLQGALLDGTNQEYIMLETL